MKKKTMILLTAVLCASVGALVMFLNRPYKPVSFTVDGDQWSAKTVDGGSLLLELHNDNKSREWSIVSEPETFVSDYHNIAENISEFHIIALEDGNGEMVFQCVKDDGSADMYTLGLSISRHQKTNLQIDSITFKISGCLKQGMEEKLTETAKEPRKIGNAQGNLQGMAIYSSCPFVHEDSQWELQIYVQEDMLIDGELTMDDSCRFLIQAVSGEDSYVFLDEMIQLGIPEAGIWEDEQEKMHIVLRDVRTARYKVSDFVFNPEEKKFIGSDVLDGEGINYIGTTGK